MKIKVKFNLKPFLNYIAVILATAIMITTVLVALPLTERFTKGTPFDLITKDSEYWSSDFILTLSTNNQEKIKSTREVIYKRLKNFGVERVSFTYGEEDETGNTSLKVFVTSTRDRDLVKELVSNRFDVRIVTRKEEVDFFDEEDPYAYLLATNYENTDWDRSKFRNVYITELKTTDNIYSNFAIFKLWPNRQGEFNQFLNLHKGEHIGVSIDGFVTPYLVPFEEQSIFAVPLTVDGKEPIEAIDILYNSGIIPVDITLASESNSDPDIISIDYIRITFGLAISLLLVYIYMLMIGHTDSEILKKSFIATILSISIYLTLLKLLQIPIDTFLLPVVAILTFMLVRTLSENEDSIVYIEIGLIVVLGLIAILGFGYMNILAKNLIALIIISKLSLIASKWYINKVKEIK